LDSVRVPWDGAREPLSLFERESEEDVLPYCFWRGMAALAYGPLWGWLSRRMRPETISCDDLRNFGSRGYGQYLREVAELDRFARENYGKRVIHLALRWVLDQPSVSTKPIDVMDTGQFNSEADIPERILDDSFVPKTGRLTSAGSSTSGLGRRTPLSI